ncbi:hypothetical protein U2261_13380 [Achromobacter xylosoxidans]|jgi:hypothetical protein|uniref:hypothetical protein n=1 Tax=Achromobacter TaxID=222 RepID=UPI0009707F41|nr:hypothetical protein [Achromobacter xylosoxidans]MCH4574442.1 hypothetical protein [Achromobacter xylosoxidans]MDD7988277.1 hypothetical protein [Achromobacter xylosoxidans]MDH0520793.1 hypothetical protein [Achromobacter xylosoxidans]MDH0544765.1 hypothetical protein [Achromobacter xylosoxidans]MDZ5615606.1 hypothetical protein [Achromobacter xylosoxidans]
MKIKESDGSVVDVFSIYWLGAETYFYGLQAGHGGLQAYRLEEVTIVEREMNFKTVFFSNGSAHGVNHWALIQEGLLDDLLELDKVAYERFITILKSERVLSDGFY